MKKQKKKQLSKKERLFLESTTFYPPKRTWKKQEHYAPCISYKSSLMAWGVVNASKAQVFSMWRMSLKELETLLKKAKARKKAAPKDSATLVHFNPELILLIT